MGDVIRRTGVFLQDVREILRKSNDERAKCPRCRGSGLLYLHSNWLRSASNTPCLFCEGVGVMPIVGLRGYLIGRTDAMLSTKQEKKTYPVVPDNIQVHNSGRQKSTKLSTRRHFKIQSQLFYNPLTNPVWLLEAQREAFLVKSSQKEAAEHSSDHRDSDDTSPVGLIGLDQAGWRYRHRFYARTSAPFSNPTSTSQADSRVKEWQAADGSLQGSDLRGVSEAVVDLDSLSHVQSNLLDSNKHVKSSTRGHRSSRRPRNRIREKAEKEAEARARRVQKPVSEASSKTPSAHSWNPLLRMCRSLMLLTTPDPKKRLIQEIPDNIAAAA